MIQTEKLTKVYKTFQKQAGVKASIAALFRREYVYKTALCDFDLQIAEGELIGLIGPNGAGKTTLVKLLTGIIAPTSGKISVLGHYPNKLEDDLKKQYAIVMGQKSQLFFDLTAGDTFLLFRELYGIAPEVYRKNLDYFVTLFDVAELLHVQVRTLSLGERMKLELIAALLHDPKILFLDEPTIGLDAVAQRQIRSFLKEINRQKGTTIILTSHYMEDIKQLCQRCVVVNHGRKVYDGDTEKLFRKYQTSKIITVTFEEPIAFQVPKECQLLEYTSEKAVLCVSEAQATELLSQLIREYEKASFTLEEEDIGTIVERIYKEKE